MTAKTVNTVCPYCGVGCGMELSVQDNEVTQLRGQKSHPANFGRLCTKGLTAHQVIDAPTRLLHAQIRSSQSESFQQIQAKENIQVIAQKIRTIIEQYGSDAFAFYVSGQLSYETQYVANKFCKGYLKTNNIDSNSRLCMSSAASGYKLSLGADAPPGCYEDFESAELFFVIGANMADCHPILFSRMVDQKEKNGAKIVVVDPRKTATAEKADIHLPIKPGTDLALLNGLLYELIRSKRIDCDFIKNYTEGWENVESLVQGYPPHIVSEITTLAIEDIQTVAHWMGSASRWLTLWTMGLNQSTKGTANTSAICNLHLATGTLSKPGCGPFSLTGQPNAMGGREVGYLNQGLPGQRCVSDENDRAFIESLWNLPQGTISPTPGLDTIQLFRSLAEGNVKCIWIIGSNPVATVANRAHVIEGLKTAEFVIVQDGFHPTETSEYAHCLLPGAIWPEYTGTFVNSERCVSLMQKALDPRGDGLPDWQWITRVAQEMGWKQAFSYFTAEDIFNEIRQTKNPQTGYDLSGITYEKLHQNPIQWPYSENTQTRGKHRYIQEDGAYRFATTSGKALFHSQPYVDSAEMPNDTHPLIFTTGRLPHQWHTRTKTGSIATLNKLNPSPYLEIHPDDARLFNIQSNQRIRISSKRGTASLPAKLSEKIAKGTVFAPFHWNDTAGEGLCVNHITNDAVDPISLQPELKQCAVRLEAIEEKESAMNETNTITLTQEKKPNESNSFSSEQKEYLEGLMAGYRQQGGAFPGSSSNASQEEEEVYGTPLSDLSKEERIKHEANPLDLWEKMCQHASAKKFPEGGDVFRFKFHGLFYVTPAQEAFMLRCRIAGGILSAGQMRGLAQIAESWGGNYSDLTTRANIQIREIQPEDIMQVLTKLYDLGLTSRGAGADNIRNITASPTSGIDPSEVYDVRSLAKSLHYHILNNRDLYGLPRKFNVSFDNGGVISVVSDTNDIGFLATRVEEGHDVEPGTYFRVLLGGITGHQTFAKDTGLLLKPDECIPAAVAMIRVYIENGDRTNRKKARLKYLLERWGFDKFLEETQKKLSFPLRYFPYENCKKRAHTIKHGHIGVYPQKQPGLNYIGVVIPVGRMKPKQMRALAELAETYGSSEFRLTVWQNLVIPNIPEEHIETVKRKLVRMGFHHRSTSISGGLVACTGNTGCKFSSTNTKGQAMELTEYLEKKVKLDFPINIHLTGCPHSCAQHYCGDIGLLGTKVNQDGNQVEGYNIVVGGGVDQDQGLGRELFKQIPFTQVPSLLERILKIYLEKRKSGETFVEYTRRHEIRELQEQFQK